VTWTCTCSCYRPRTLNNLTGNGKWIGRIFGGAKEHRKSLGNTKDKRRKPGETGCNWSNRKPKWRKSQKTEEAERGIGKFAIFYGVTQEEQWWWIRNTAFAKTRITVEVIFTALRIVSRVVPTVQQSYPVGLPIRPLLLFHRDWCYFTTVSAVISYERTWAGFVAKLSVYRVTVLGVPAIGVVLDAFSQMLSQHHPTETAWLKILTSCILHPKSLKWLEVYQRTR
jgi:hypothetical protein